MALGAVVSFYLGARYQIKGQELQKFLVASMARATVPTVEKNPPMAPTVQQSDNAAVND